MSDNFIDYSELVDEAMHIIIKKSLEIVAKHSFIGDHHFFISFLTNYKGVVISEKLKEKYPEEMTIVLQFQFENLFVTDEYFAVTLSFDNVKEKLVIPFKALTAFADPSVKFGLQFRHYEEEYDNQEDDNSSDNSEKTIDDSQLYAHSQQDSPLSTKKTNKVISLDNFRKRNKNK